jgi:predicted Fe-S protein YdhL (DUF1289 family)
MPDAFPIASPCTGICQLDPESGLCRGCLRTGAEIAAWPGAGDAEKLEIVARLRERRRTAGRTSAADAKPRRRTQRRGAGG